METVTVSSKYQVVIPRAIREASGLRVGENLQVLNYGRRIELIPTEPMENLRGMFKGMNTDFDREDDRK